MRLVAPGRLAGILVKYLMPQKLRLKWIEMVGFHFKKKAQGFTKDITFPIINIGLISGSVLFKQGGKNLLQGLSKAIGYTYHWC